MPFFLTSELSKITSAIVVAIYGTLGSTCCLRRETVQMQVKYFTEVLGWYFCLIADFFPAISFL